MTRSLAAVALVGAIACRGAAPQSDAQASQAAAPPESEAPVALNPDVPIAYPPALFDQKVEGDVTLRLFVDSTGKLIPESTRVAEPSGYPALDSAALAGAAGLRFAPGYPALDSAALAGAAGLRFAPAKRHGVPVATAFLQPVEFRQVGTTRTGGGGGGGGGAGGTVTLPPPAASTPVAPPAPPPVPPRPRPPVVRPAPDTTRADTTRARPDTARPSPDTTKARTDTSASAH